MVNLHAQIPESFLTLCAHVHISSKCASYGLFTALDCESTNIWIFICGVWNLRIYEYRILSQFLHLYFYMWCENTNSLSWLGQWDRCHHRFQCRLLQQNLYNLQYRTFWIKLCEMKIKHGIQTINPKPRQYKISCQSPILLNPFKLLQILQEDTLKKTDKAKNLSYFLLGNLLKWYSLKVCRPVTPPPSLPTSSCV